MGCGKTLPSREGCVGGWRGLCDLGMCVRSVCEGGTRFLERKLCKELYTAVAGLFGLYGFVRGGFGWVCALTFSSSQLTKYSNPISEEGWRRKSGATETLTSHAGSDNLDLVLSFAISLRKATARPAWLSPSGLFSVRAADIQFQQTQSTNGGSQGVRCYTYSS